MMYLLQSAVTMDVTNMALDRLIVVALFLLVVIALVFINGVFLKIGEKELNIGGVRRLLAKKDEDILLKEALHRFSEEVDHEVNGDLYDLVDSLNAQVEKVALREHCYFTFSKFIAIVQSELEKRVRRNNLKSKLAKINREKYVDSILRDIENKYEMLQVKVSQLQCEDEYAQFSVIREAVRNILCRFVDGAKDIVIAGCRRKLEKYRSSESRFKTEAAKKFSCIDPIKKNETYINDLES